MYLCHSKENEGFLVKNGGTSIVVGVTFTY